MKDIDHARVQSDLKEDQRMILDLGPKEEETRCKATAVKLADQRNRLAAALARMVPVSHASPGGKTEALCREVIAKELYADLEKIQAEGMVTVENDAEENKTRIALANPSKAEAALAPKSHQYR